MKRWSWLVIVLQAAVLAYIAGEREWIRAYGHTVWLRTAPVDPRDPFRGDYVQLDYELAQLSADEMKQLETARSAKRQVVYVGLQEDGTGVAERTVIAMAPPESGPFIRGQMGTAIGRDWRWRGEIKFGIEKYFVPQGAGLAIEEQRGQRGDWQTAMEVEVAVSPGGTPVVRGYRWSPLGVRLEVLETPPPRVNNAIEPGQRLSPRLSIQIRNQGDTPWALLDDPQHCSWQLVQVSGAGWTPETVQRDCSAAAGQYQPVLLQPGSVHAIEVDMADAAWWVRDDDGFSEVGDPKRGWQMYRFVYTPPRDAVASDVPLWRSSLRTAAFQASGRVD